MCDLDKKVLIFNLLKKFNLINKNKSKKIYRYKNSNVLREIEPYLYDRGFNLIDMPEVNFIFQNNEDVVINKKISDILDKFFENDFLNYTFKKILFEMYKKCIKYYFKEKYIPKNIFRN